MVRDMFTSIGDLEFYGVISMIIFVVFFGLLILHTYTIKKKDVEGFSNMPLDDGSKESDEIQDS